MHPRRSWLTDPRVQLALIVVVAAVLRLVALHSAPPGLFGDEATDGLDALDVLAGRGAVFFPANFGREGLHIWIVAGAFRWLGITPFALRLPSALAGIATVAATYWLAHELVTAWLTPAGTGTVPARRLAAWLPLVSALYLATSYWHIHFSRFGIRGVFTPLCGALAFAAFWRAVNLAAPGPAAGGLHGGGSPGRSGLSRNLLRSPMAWFAISGFWLGLGLHFYTASRFLPLFLGGYLVLQAALARLLHRPGDALLRHFWRGILLLYAVAGVVFAPLAVYFLQHPGSFSQRASTVAAFGAQRPWERMAAAAVANVLQFFVPGSGDLAQFYNLPGRAVFDVASALLALIGIVVLLSMWRRPASLFLLTWWPALLLPSFLATDRYPTLPRVLGTIPGVYFFPAVGALSVAWFAAARWYHPERSTPGSRRPWAYPLATGLVAAGLFVHTGLACRDYFLRWAPSAATFDAFEGDMTAAWRWLGSHSPDQHVYLSSDIYRHPTFMLLQEHASVTRYFEQSDPHLSWFDARVALPWPPDGEGATYLLAASSWPSAEAQAFLTGATVAGEVPDPQGKPALRVLTMPAGARATGTDSLNVPFGQNLALTGFAQSMAASGAPVLRLDWATAGPVPADWDGYTLELTGLQSQPAWHLSLPFDAFRATEWVKNGHFSTWHHLDMAGAPPDGLRLRLLHAGSGQPLANPYAADGWYQISFQPRGSS